MSTEKSGTPSAATPKAVTTIPGVGAPVDPLSAAHGVPIDAFAWSVEPADVTVLPTQPAVPVLPEPSAPSVSASPPVLPEEVAVPPAPATPMDAQTTPHDEAAATAAPAAGQATPVLSPMPGTEPQERPPTATDSVADTPSYESAASVEADDVAAAAVTDPSSPPSSVPKTLALVSFKLTILDFSGKPVSGLKYRVIAAGKTYNGASNSEGRIADILDLEPNQALEFFVRKSNGEFSSKYSGRVECADMNVCAISPHIKITLETEPHTGSAGAVPTKPVKPPESSAPVAPLAGAIAGGGKHPAPAIQTCRNPEGNPSATFLEKSLDWAKRHLIPTFSLWGWDDFKTKTTACTVPTYQLPQAKSTTAVVKAPAAVKAQASTPPAKAPVPAASPTRPTAPATPEGALGPTLARSINQEVPPEVLRLIDIMEEQAGWEWRKMFATGLSSAGIMAGITNKTFMPTTGKVKSTPDHRCYPSVKIGLWRANLVRGINNDIPAKGAGTWLLSQGFSDVTAETPDGRWALPGDVLVYRNSDAVLAKRQKVFDTAMVAYNKQLALWQENNAAQEKNNLDAAPGRQQASTRRPVKPKMSKPPSPPSIESYGHIDVRTYDGYISDFHTTNFPRPSKLVLIGVYRKVCDPLADLRVRAYLEVLASRETRGIAEPDSWYALGTMIDGSKRAKSIAQHPWLDRPIPKPGTRVAGRFQIVVGSYMDAVREYGLPSDFLPKNQLRIAVLQLEIRGALGPIRNGNITAGTKLLVHEWSCLPGASQNGTYTIDQLKIDHQKFMRELTK